MAAFPLFPTVCDCCQCLSRLRKSRRFLKNVAKMLPRNKPPNNKKPLLHDGEGADLKTGCENFHKHSNA
nr:MAG TPA: hypothetical protein [Caudoviricetes sp.]